MSELQRNVSGVGSGWTSRRWWWRYRCWIVQSIRTAICPDAISRWRRHDGGWVDWTQKCALQFPSHLRYDAGLSKVRCHLSQKFHCKWNETRDFHFIFIAIFNLHMLNWILLIGPDWECARASALFLASHRILVFRTRSHARTRAHIAFNDLVN